MRRVEAVCGGCIQIGGWSRQPSFSPEVLAPLHDLNLKFLDLAGAHAGGWRTSGALGLPGGVSERLAPMTASQRAAAANCPYALFDLRFHDEAHWRTRLRGAAEWRVADQGADRGDTADFVAARALLCVARRQHHPLRRAASSSA